MKHRPSTQRSLPIRLAIAVLTIAAAFLWGCEEPSGETARVPQSLVILRQAPGVFLTEAPTERYVFEVQNFVRADVSVFEEGEVSGPALQPLWDSAGIRWGFRKKDNPERIFWAQKNQSYSTKEGEASYAIQVEDRHKARFIPQDLPAALLQESEGNLEIYGEINIEGIAIGGTLDLPPDFKSKILQVTEISGRVLDFDPIRAENDQNKVVPGASIYYIHKESGRIFQAFSDPNGQYRVSVRYYGNFYRVVLARGRKPLVEDDVLVHAAGRPLISNEDLGLNLLPPGTSIADNVLYDITEYDDLADSVPLEATQTAEAPVQGNAVDIQNTAMIPGAYLLFYDKTGQRIFLVMADHQGAFNVKLPTLSGGTVNGVSFAPSALGYIPEAPFLVLGQGNIPRTLLRIVRFRPDPGAQISDRDIDNTQDRDKDGLPDAIDPNSDNRDTDGDGIPDGADVDVDGNGVPDNGTDADGDGIHDAADVDVDGDGTPDNGTDADNDGINDEHDTIDNTQDRDKDGLPDAVDPNPDNWDTDGDGIPDGADVDVDGDGTPDNGTDADNDGIHDAADVDVNGDGTNDNGTDADNDGINDEHDTIDNTQDRDNDGLPDAIDPDPDNPDTDGDGIPDGVDADVNGDNVIDNGKDANGDGIRDGSLLKPDLSWDESVSTSVMDSNGGKFDFGGSPVSVRLKVNAVALSGGNFSYVWSLNDTVDSSKTGDDVTFALSSAGSNTIKVAVSNAAGSSELSRTYELNSNPNNVSITAPTANERIDIGSGAAFDLEASAQDSDSNQSLSYSWHIDSGAGFHSLGISSSGSPGASSSKAYTFTQAAGDYTLKVIVSDDDGGSAEATVPITLVGDASSQSSNTRPVIEHISGTRAAPENNPIHRDGSASAEIQVRNRVSANTIEIASISWELDGVLQRGTTAYEPGTDEYEESLTLTGPSHTVTMQVRNKIGELAEWSRTYHLNEAPELDELETAANPGPYSIPDAHTITAQATDANGGTLTYTAAIAPGHDVASESADFRALGGSLPGTSGALVSLPLDFDIGLSAGEYTLRIRVSDAHGGAADTLRRNIVLTGASSTVSATAPKIFWTAATTGFDSGDEADATLTEAATVFDATSGESVTVAVRVEDPRTPSKTTGFTYQWELNGSAFTPQSPGTGTAAQVSRTLTKAGLNTIALVVVNDDGEASAEALRKFYLNTIPSGLRITAPTSNQTIQLSGSKDLTLSASATDSIDDALSYSWKIYGKQADGSWSSTGTEIGTQATLDYTFSQAAGDYQIRVSATDSHNAAAVMQSAGSDRVDVRLNAAPVVSFVSPSRSDSGQATVGVDVEFEVGVTDANLANPNLGTDFTYTWEYQSPAGTWSTLPSSVPTPHKMTLKTTDFTSTVSGSPYKVRVRVADADGATAVREYSLSMLANRAPTVEFTGATPGENARFQLADVNVQTPARSFFVTAADPEGDTLSYEWYEGGSSTATSTESSWTDQQFYSPIRGKSSSEIQAMTEEERHNVLVTVVVSDGRNTVSVTRTLRLNIAPAIASVSASSNVTRILIGDGSSITYTVSASDPEGDALSYQWHYRKSGEAWTDFAAATEATYTMVSPQGGSNDFPGNYEFAVTVTDKPGATVDTKSAPQTIAIDAKGLVVRTIERSAVSYIVEAKDRATQDYPSEANNLPFSDPRVGSAVVYHASALTVQPDGRYHLPILGVDYGDGVFIFRAGHRYLIRVTTVDSQGERTIGPEIPGNF